MIRIPKIKPGKTATLSIASLQLIDTAQREVQVLIMNPTRELAVQVCTCTCVCMCVCMCVYECVCSCVDSVQCRSSSFTPRAFCTGVCVYVCMYLYKSTCLRHKASNFCCILICPYGRPSVCCSVF